MYGGPWSVDRGLLTSLQSFRAKRRIWELCFRKTNHPKRLPHPRNLFPSVSSAFLLYPHQVIPSRNLVPSGGVHKLQLQPGDFVIALANDIDCFYSPGFQLR